MPRRAANQGRRFPVVWPTFNAPVTTAPPIVVGRLRVTAGAIAYSENSVSIQSICARSSLPTTSTWPAGLLGAHALEVLLAGAVLGNPLAGEVPGLDLGRGSASCSARVSSVITRLPRV